MSKTDANTAAGDVVTISLPIEGPYGILLDPDKEGCAAVVRSWERLPNGKFGPIQKHGGVHIGDVLWSINETNLSQSPFSEVISMLNDKNLQQKNVKFLNSGEHYRRKQGKVRTSGTLRTNTKNPFLSIIKSYRIVSAGSSKFAEYEITSQLKVASTRVEKEKIFQWTVWKRYSDFESLEVSMRTSLGWQMEHIEFPPAYTFTVNKLSPEFLNRRKDELNEYWQKIISLDKVTDFSKHHCCEALKMFLDIEHVMRGEESVNTTYEALEGKPTDEAQKEYVTIDNSGDTKRTSKRLSVRNVARNSRKGSGIMNDGVGETQAASNTNTTASTAQSPPPPPPPTKSTSRIESETTITSDYVSVPSLPTKGHPTIDPVSASSLPPKATGTRANLFAQINSRRID